MAICLNRGTPRSTPEYYGLRYISNVILALVVILTLSTTSHCYSMALNIDITTSIHNLFHRMIMGVTIWVVLFLHYLISLLLL